MHQRKSTDKFFFIGIMLMNYKCELPKIFCKEPWFSGQNKSGFSFPGFIFYRLPDIIFNLLLLFWQEATV